MNRLGTALAAAALALLLPACTAVIPIDVTRDVPLEADAGAFDTSQVIDLTTEADVWSHRDQVDAVSIDDITATVVSVEADHAASSVTIDLTFRAEGAPEDGSQDLHVGAFDALAFIPGTTVKLHGSAQLDAFLDHVLHGSGRFTAIASGSVDGHADALLRIGLKGSVGYKVVGG